MKSRVTEVGVVRLGDTTNVHVFRDDNASAKIYTRPSHHSSVHRLINLIIKMEEQDKVRVEPYKIVSGWYARRRV